MTGQQMRFFRKFGLIAALIVAILILYGCGSSALLGETYAPPTPVQHDYEPPTNGSIYREGTEVKLFEDLKAGRIGDILTVRSIRTS